MTNRHPTAAPGMTVGLLGGSFDPPHEGHLHISEVALKRLGLNQVWWLVTPGNPLKERGPADLSRRLDACETLINRRVGIVATDLEARLGTRYTSETLRSMQRHYPNVRFVWLMGADNLVEFHRRRPLCQIAPRSQTGNGIALPACTLLDVTFASDEGAVLNKNPRERRLDMRHA